MASDTNITLNIKNNSAGNMSLEGDSSLFLTDAKWTTEPPTTIVAGTTGKMEAHRNDNRTKGFVTYTLSDNTTVLTISFEVRDSHHDSNSGDAALSSNPGNPNNYIVKETDSNFEKQVSFPEGREVITYWLVEDA